MGERKGPNVDITNFPRSAPKEVWKWYYRRLRVSVREHEKAFVDTMIYGSGFVQYNNNEDPKYIPIQQVRIDPDALPRR